MTEPHPRPSRVAIWTIAGIALVAAIVAALVAPDEWAAGEGRLDVIVNGETTSVDVQVGSTEPIVVSPSGDGVGFSLPRGVPTSEAVRVEIDVPVDAKVEATLTLSDGSTEPMPVIASGGAVTATRRPPDDVHLILPLLAIVVLLWVSEAIPLHVTALAIPVVLAMSGTTTAREALAPFFDPIIVLFLAGFLLAEAMHRVRLDHLVAVQLVARAGAGPLRLFASMVALAAFLSMWMSNTAAVAVLIPIALAVTEPLDDSSYRRVMVLGIAYAGTVGGVGSVIGTPANPLAVRFIDELTGRTITFVDWFVFGLPMVLLFLPVMATILWKAMGTTVDPNRFAEARAAALEAQQKQGPLTRDQIEVLSVFALVMAGWLTQSWHDQSPSIVALAGTIVLMLLGRIETDDLGTISWPTLLTFGGGLTMGVAMVDSGASDWIVTRLTGASDWPTPLAVLLVAVTALITTTVASNTAAAATLIPLAIPLAGLIGVDPVMLVVVVAIASSVDFALVIGTPPTMLAYSTGLFTSGEILRRGALLDIVGIAILVGLVVPFWQLVGAL